jgi:peroxiredoxin 3
LDEFKEIGCQVFAASVDSEYSHLAWTKTARKDGGLGSDLRLPLLSDFDKNMSRNYGVLIDERVSLRGLFIIDPTGTVRHATINDLGIGRSVDETLRVVKAIQFNDKHGEVCPANWQPGKSTINTSNPNEYFNKLK